MKTLLEYLILEAKEPDLPDGFERIKLQGGLSKEAKRILQFSSYKKASIAAASKDGRKAIKDGLEATGSEEKDPIAFVKEFFEGSSKLNTYIDEAKERDAKKFGGNTDDGVFLSLKSGDGSWMDVGGKGKTKSSIRVIRFWVESTIIAYLGRSDLGVGFAYNEPYNLFYVYRKK